MQNSTDLVGGFDFSQIKQGAFLTTKNGEKINTMTIGWGACGIMWGAPTLMVMVRKSRYTYDLIEQAGEFTVTFPTDDLRQELKICGSTSGRDGDKFAQTGLKTKAAHKIDTPIIDCHGKHYECKTVFKTEMNKANLDAAVGDHWYNGSDSDYHVLYFGQIVDTYTD